MNTNSKPPRPEYKFDKCEGSGSYLPVVVDSQMAGCWHILSGLYTNEKAKFATQMRKLNLSHRQATQMENKICHTDACRPLMGIQVAFTDLPHRRKT